MLPHLKRVVNLSLDRSLKLGICRSCCIKALVFYGDILVAVCRVQNDTGLTSLDCDWRLILE